MNKLKLEELSVESFDTTPGAGAERGTVFAEQCTCPNVNTCGWASCQTNCNTCAPNSCWGTCDGSCEWGTCVGYDTCGGGNTCWDSCPACGTSSFC